VVQQRGLSGGTEDWQTVRDVPPLRCGRLAIALTRDSPDEPRTVMDFCAFAAL
jgi:hypothetical protein